VGVGELLPRSYSCTNAQAIQATHGARSWLTGRERVVETLQGQTVWEGEVLVFTLHGHPTAQRCYAWEVNGQVTAVLHEPPVDSPQTAVRAVIVAGFEGVGEDGLAEGKQERPGALPKAVYGSKPSVGSAVLRPGNAKRKVGCLAR